MPQTPALPAHYELQHCLGEGGFGTVFEAFDSKLRRSVAIKCLKNLADSDQSARLVQEAQLAASLQHAAFVKIYALEESGSTRSIVMELVRGRTLKQLLADTPPDQQQALSIARQIAEAMQEAHASGLVHGDLKPSNVMLQPPHTVRILDFGLATQADTEATSSLQQADPQGTIAYMAPERLLGQPLRPSSDIYALGVILYELLTGARPYAELNGLALAAAQMQSSSRQWKYPDTLPPAMVQLIQAMTAPAPQRLPSMREVSQQLAALEGVKTPAATTVRRMAARWWRHATLATAALLTLTAGASWLASTSPNLLTSLQTTLRPHSETRELQHALRALAMWDRPGELDEAERRFSTVIQNNPNNGAAVAGMALVYCRRFSTDERDDTWLRKAEAAAQQALRLSPQLALAHVAHADVLRISEKNQAALAEFDVALGLDPENIFALVGKMDALQQLRRFDDALIMAQQALQRHPAERLFADQIGAVHYAQARYAEAEQAFRQSIKIQPDAVFSYANLSAALTSQGQQDAALNILQQGLQIRPSAWLYGNLGNILFLRSDYLGAAAAFESAVAPDQGSPNDYLGWANLGDTLLWIPGRTADARKAYARASELLAPRLARSPEDVTLLSRMGLYYARSSDKQRSLPLLQRALALSPGAADVQFRAALAYELIGERQQALQAIHHAIKAGYPIPFIEAAPELLALRRDSAYAQLR